MHDVFISHSTHDRTIATAACATLEANGIRCWIAPRDILGGRDYADEIIEAIHSARVMVLIFSSHANASEDVKREVQAAFNRQVTVVPFRIEDIQPSGSLEYYLAGRHWLDALTPPVEQKISQLLDNVRRLLEARTGPGPPPPRTALHLAKALVRHPRASPAIWLAAAAIAIAVALGTIWLVIGALNRSTQPLAVVDAHRLSDCNHMLDQNDDMQSRAATFVQGNLTERENAVKALLQSGRSGSDIYYPAIKNTTTPVGDYAALSHYWEQFSACLNDKTLDFAKVSGVISFPDEFWERTRTLRHLFGENWKGSGKVLPDFMSNFRDVCLQFKESRSHANPYGQAVDCSL